MPKPRIYGKMNVICRGLSSCPYPKSLWAAEHPGLKKPRDGKEKRKDIVYSMKENLEPVGTQEAWQHWLEEAINHALNGRENRLNQMLAPRYETCDFENQTITLVYSLYDWEMNPRGELHGGIIASMFDVSLGITARCACQCPQIATTDISVSYLRRVEADDTIRIVTKVQKSGKLMVRITAEAYSDKTGKVVATAQGSFMVLKI